ncbi:hypothetical protein C5C30_09095 [Rathayibacter sp. AY2B5]|nr:hypothetical protein C5C30_09095 [Rathayibacter sp. AY2B5]
MVGGSACRFPGAIRPRRRPPGERWSDEPGGAMKIMLVMRSDGSYAGGDAPEDYAAWADYDASLKADGVLVDSGRFADASGDVSVETDLTVAGRESGTPAPSRAEERSALVGYYLLDCPTRDDAVRYARRAPLYGSVEVHEQAQY